MNYLSKIALFLLIINSKLILGFEIPHPCLPTSELEKICLNCKNEKDHQKPVQSLSDLSTNLNSPTLKYELFAKKAEELNSANVILKEKLASMFRTLRDGDKEPTHINGKVEIEKTFDSFKKLSIISKEAILAQKRFNICVTMCSAVRKMELADEMKHLQKLKIALLVGQPLLANKAFEKMFVNMTDEFADSEKEFSKEEFETALNSALFQNLQTILDKSSEYFKFNEDGLKPIFKNATYQQVMEYNSNLITRFPSISGDVIKELAVKEVNDPKTKTQACFFVDKYKKYTTKKEHQEIALDVGLFAVPFVLGPVARMGTFSAEFLFAERLATWGMRTSEVGNAVKIADISFQALLAGNEGKAIYEKYLACQEAERLFLLNADAKKMTTLDNCKKDLSDKLFISEVASAGLLASSFTPRALTLFKSMSVSSPKVKVEAGVTSLLFKDFGGGKNKMIQSEIEAMIKVTKLEKSALNNLSNTAVSKKAAVEKFKTKNGLEVSNSLAIIKPENLAEYQKVIGKDTVELLFIPGSEVPFLPNAINKVGHVAIRIGDKVYHQTGGSGFKIETFENFLAKTKKEYKVFGHVMESSEKERAVMESYFKKMHDKQLPYSFLVNNCSQAVCKAMSLADFEKVSPLLAHDPVLIGLKAKRSERVVMKTFYNPSKDLSEKELAIATVNNRLAFYGVPAAAATGATAGGYEAIDFVINYLNQIKESK